LYNRRISKKISVGGVFLGGNSPITIQSMTNTQTADVAATVTQIKALEAEGCEIIRVAVNNKEAAASFAEIKKQITNIPLVADIHFDHNLAMAAINAGADKIRINPGNIGDEWKIEEVAKAAKNRKIPIRVGVNSGSLDTDLIDKYGGVTAQGLADAALRNIAALNKYDFDDIVISIKASNIPMTLAAHEILAPQTNYPLHLGITEAGTLFSGTIKSTAGLAAMLTRGIGDTIRVSLTSDPIEEVRVAKELLKSLGLRQFGPEIISCPTCGRTQIDLISIANEIEYKIKHIKSPIKIAIMGCIVNGPGEAKDCDIGIAGGKGEGILFKKGEIIRKISENKMAAELLAEIEMLERNFNG